MSGPPNRGHLGFRVWILLTTLTGSACMGTKAQKDFEVKQPWGPLRVIQGSSAILPCVLTSDVFDGPTKWFKGKGMGQQLIYSDKDHTSARAQRANHSHGNMTILTSNITTQDDGVYYHVKFHQNNRSYVEYKSGLGTRLSVVSVLQCPEDPGISIFFFVTGLLGLKALLLLNILTIYIIRKRRI
uniref:Signal-regulatory protein beta-1-like n=1 Tax=Phascolarctos cinereus TaxID=38626 RepID=A0A6P5KKY7_PHACI|nr:signal-regulatory protein beta-1-like [Phascolarctos cinereus]